MLSIGGTSGLRGTRCAFQREEGYLEKSLYGLKLLTGAVNITHTWNGVSGYGNIAGMRRKKERENEDHYHMCGVFNTLLYCCGRSRISRWTYGITLMPSLKNTGLKKCSRCGFRKTRISIWAVPAVGCRNCGFIIYAVSEKEAIAAWNRRAG